MKAISNYTTNILCVRQPLGKPNAMKLAPIAEVKPRIKNDSLEFYATAILRFEKSIIGFDGWTEGLDGWSCWTVESSPPNGPA